MATRRKVHKLPRFSRSEMDALVHMCVYTSVCPRSAATARSLESLVRRGYAKRHRISLHHPVARAMVKGKVAYCYKVTAAGMKALRLVYARR